MEKLREAVNGGAHLSFDIVGGAQNPDSTLTALRNLHNGGRLVLMGSMTSTLPTSYGELMFNNWEIKRQFMYPINAYKKLLNPIRSGLLDINVIHSNIFSLEEFPVAIDAAAKAGNLECVVLQL